MKKTTQGFTLVELLVVIAILGVLMGTLFPSISSAIMKSNTSAMQTKGKKLWDAITIAGTDRMSAGKSDASVWPRSAKNLSDDSEDISGKPFSSAEKYFEELFDVTKNATEEHNPYVKGLDLGYLAGGGVPTAPGSVKSLDGKYCAWTVLKGVTDDVPALMPVLVTRNLSCKAIPTTGQIDGKSNTRVEVGKDRSQPFGNKYFVLVRRDGANAVMEGRYNRIREIFQETSFMIKSDIELEYLEPSGE